MMRPLPPELLAKIKEIRSWMFDGDMDKVAARSRKSRQWVSKVLNGHTFNAQIIEAGIEVMEENKARFRCTPKIIQPSLPPCLPDDKGSL